MKRLGLRARVASSFALGALAVSALLAVSTYEVTRSQLISSRDRTAVRTAHFDAATVQEGLSSSDHSVVDVLRLLDTGTARRPVVRRDGQWYARGADTGITDAIPQSLQDLATRGATAIQRVRVDGVPTVVVAVPMPKVRAVYYEADDLTELDHTLRSLALVLTAAAVGTAAAAAAVGLWVGRAVVRPLTSVADTASLIASGHLGVRLDPRREPDLARLAESFNSMLDTLAARIESDRRFAADVSHELRSPLQTLAAAVSVLEKAPAREDARTAAATELVVAELRRFNHLVNDLLELSKGDQPAHRTETNVRELVAQQCAARGVCLEAGGAVVGKVDARRVQQLLVNLLDNADTYGGGATAVRVMREGERVVIEVDDEGPGVAAEERDVIFRRFARGRTAGSRGAGAEGTGLGLALVARHADAHGGSACVVDRPGGGARFRVELPG